MPTYPDLLAEAKDLRERATAFETHVMEARVGASDTSTLFHVENEAYQARHAYNEIVHSLEPLA